MKVVTTSLLLCIAAPAILADSSETKMLDTIHSGLYIQEVWHGTIYLDDGSKYGTGNAFVRYDSTSACLRCLFYGDIDTVYMFEPYSARDMRSNPCVIRSPSGFSGVVPDTLENRKVRRMLSKAGNRPNWNFVTLEVVHLTKCAIVNTYRSSVALININAKRRSEPLFILREVVVVLLACTE
jgi:hypothetical protein